MVILVPRHRADCAIRGSRASGTVGQERLTSMLFLTGEEGQGLVAYALILILVVLVLLTALSLVQVDVLRLYKDTTNVVGKIFAP